MILNLEKEVALPKHLLEPTRNPLRLVELPCHQMLIDLTSQTARKPDQPFRMPRQKLFGDPRLTIKPMQRSLTRQANQVAIPSLALRQHKKMLIPTAQIAMILRLRKIKFAAKNRLHTLLLHRVKKMDSTVDVAMIGHSRSRLANLVQVPGKFIDIASAVKKGVVRMKMEVGKLCCHPSSLVLCSQRKTRP